MAAAREGRAAIAERRHRPNGRRPTLLVLSMLVGATPPTAPSRAEPTARRQDRTSTTCAGLDTSTLRIVSLVPAVTSTLDALGLTSCLVGRALDDRTASAARVQVVGTVLRPDVESVLATEPTMVFTGPGPAATRLASILGEQRVTAVRLERLDDVVAGVRVVADKVGRAGRGRQLADSIETGLTRVRELSARRRVGRPPVEVLWAVGLVPPIAAGRGGLADDLIALAGGRNVFADAAVPWFRPSTEQLAVRAAIADVVVWPIGGDLPPPGSVLPDSPWHRLLHRPGARVIEVEADLVHEAGPKLVRAAELLARHFQQSPGAAAPHPSSPDSDSEN